MAATMKWIVCVSASLLPLSAALSVSDAVAATNIPTVPKVQNAGADGFPVLPEVASLFKDVSRAVQGVQHETNTLQEELLNVEQRSHAKMKKQKAAYDQLLKKQEQANQKIQGQNAERAKAMMRLRDAAKKTQAEIKKEGEANSNQRLKLKALQKQLEQARKATEDALGVSEDAKATHAQADDDETSSGSAAGALLVEEEPPRKSLSFLEIRRAAPATASIAGRVEDEEDDYGSDEAAPTQSKLAVKKAVSSQSKRVDSTAVLGKPTIAETKAPASIWKEDHGDLSGELRRQSAIAQQSDTKSKAFTRLAADIGKDSDAMSQAPISMWKEEHRDLSGELQKESAKAQQTDAKRKAFKKLAAAIGKRSDDAMSQEAPISMWKEDHGDQAGASHSLREGPAAVLRKPSDAMQRAEPSRAASMDAKASMEAPLQETNALSSKAEEAASDEQQLIEEAGEASETDKAHENLMPSTEEQAQVLHEGASSSERMVASLSQGVKRIQVEVRRSEAQLKLHFQKAYKYGKKRHAALIKQSEVLDTTTHTMQLQEKKLETTLAKARATDKTLKRQIQAIRRILNRAVSPIASKQIV